MSASSTDKLCTTLSKMPIITEQMEKNKHQFRLKLCQRLADPGGMLGYLLVVDGNLSNQDTLLLNGIHIREVSIHFM